MTTPRANTIFVVSIPSIMDDAPSHEGTVVAVFGRASDALEQALNRMEKLFPTGKFVHHAEPEYDADGLQTITCSYSYRTDGYYARKNVRYVITEILVDTWNGI